MEIKAGDKVRIKSWEKLLVENDAYLSDFCEELDRGPGFVEDMREFCDKELNVEETWDAKEPEDEEVYTQFCVEETSWTFSSWMVEEVISEV